MVTDIREKNEDSKEARAATSNHVSGKVSLGGDIGTIFGSLWFLGTSDDQEAEVHFSRPCEASNSL